jgi:hypothetical protein
VLVIARIQSLSLTSLSLSVSFSNTTAIASSDAEMDDSDAGSALIDVLRTKTLEARFMVPAEVPTIP